jgi:hypothetical protein
MADQMTKAAIQYFDYQLITKQSPWINDRYTDIINYMPVKIPYYNDSFKTDFTNWVYNHNARQNAELQDSSYISLVKRLWFRRVKLYNWDSWENNLIEDTNYNKRMFTDVKFLDWIRYMFAVYYDYSRMRIYKQITVTEREWCWNDSMEDVTSWHFVNITKYWSNNYFPYSKCLYDKFIITQFGRWKEKWSWTNWIVRNELYADLLSVQTIFYDTALWSIPAAAWDYLCIYSWSLATQINYVSANGISSVHTPLISNALLLQYPFFWMYKIKVWSTQRVLPESSWVVQSQTLNNSTSDSEESLWLQSWKVFPDYWDVLSFVTSDWIFILTYSNTKPSESQFTYEWSTYQLWGSQYTISSLQIHNDAMYYYDINSWRLFWWLQWVSKFYFNVKNAFDFGKDYTDIVSVSWILVMIWDGKMSLINPKQLWEWIVTFTWFVPLSDRIWYFDKDSFCQEDWVFYVINSRWRLFWWTFSWYYDNVTPKPQEIPVWYMSDLTVLRKWRERVTLDVESSDIYISISHQESIDESNTHIKWNTKLLILNSWSQLRYKWMLSWIIIKWYKYDTRFWNNIYDFYWNQDWNSYTNNHEYYKTILKAQVWYESLHYTKTIAFTRTLLWYNSYVTNNNTIIKHNIDLWWWHWEIMNGDVWRDDYITNIMKLRHTWNTGTDFKNYPIWLEMIWGNGQWFITPEIRYLKNEFDKWDMYHPVKDSTSDDRTSFTISKMSTFQTNINVPADHITIEYITYWDNALEIGWVLIWYTIDNINAIRFSNNSTLQDVLLSWPSWQALTPDSWNESGVA